MADTNKVVPLPPGEKEPEPLQPDYLMWSSSDDNRWMYDPRARLWMVWDPIDNDFYDHDFVEDGPIPDGAQAYVYKQQDAAHTDWQARAEAAELAIGETCDLLGEGGDGTLFGRAESVLSDLHAYKEALDRLLYAVQRHRKAIVQDANMALAEWADVTIEITKAYALMRKESDEKSL